VENQVAVICNPCASTFVLHFRYHLRRSKDQIVAAVVSQNGIDEAIENLDYKAKDSPKLRLIQAIRAHYPDKLALTTLQAIDPDTLVSAVWDTVLDENRLRSRRKNLASIRSSVNLDLKLLFENGKNPDGIIIGPSNTFVMSDEAKDQMLTSVAASVRKDGPVSLGQITRTLSVIEDLLGHAERFSDAGDDDRESGIRRLKQLIKQISKKIDLDIGDGPTQGETLGASGPAHYPGGRHGSDPGRGGPGEGWTGNGNSEWPGIDGVTPGGIEGAPGSSDGSGENLVGAALEGAGGAGADLGDGRLGGKFGEPASKGVAEGDLIPQEVASEEEELDEVEVIDEPEDLEVADETAAEGLGGAVGGSDGDRIGTEGTEGDPGGERSGTEFSEVDGTPMGLGAEEPGDGAGQAVTEPIQDADFLPEEVVAAEEEEIEEVDEAIDEDGSPVEDDIPATETGLQGDGYATDIIANEEGGSLQTADDDTGEGPDMPNQGGHDRADPGNAESQAATVEGEEDPPDMDAQADVEELDLDEVIEEEDDSDMEAIEEDGQAGSGNGEGFESGTGPGPGAGPSGKGQGMDRHGGPGMGLPLGSLGLDQLEDAYKTDGADQATDRTLLAETFDGYLGAMERFFNQYILIPKGVYMVGGDPTAQGLPERRVRLPEFYMGKFPVTNALFEIFVEKTGYLTKAEKEGYGLVYYARRKKEVDAKTGRERFVWNSALVSQRVDGACWYQPLGHGSTLHRKRNHPVVQVSIEDAAAFAAWTGKRLPSEAEWEAASRSRDGHLYPWGDVWIDDCCNVEETQVGDTTPVDAHLQGASPFGIADTLGNVMEWTLDTDQTGDDRDRPCHIVKGGSWASTLDICLCSRCKLPPDARSNLLGFRCVAF
jgi:formylglycine-generating enzyme required for sulfatase activity